MARPRLRDKEELRNALIDTAERLIAQEGAGALTARRLADGVGVAVGTTYNVFANQDELVIALNARTLDRLAEALNAAPLPAAPVEERLIEISSRYIAFVEENRALWLVLFQHEYQHTVLQPDLPKTPNELRVERLFGLIELALGELFSAGEEPARARTARVLWAGVHGICHLSLTGRLAFMQLDDALTLASALVRCHISGIRAGCRG